MWRAGLAVLCCVVTSCDIIETGPLPTRPAEERAGGLAQNDLSLAPFRVEDLPEPADPVAGLVANHAVRIASQGASVTVATFITNEDEVWPRRRGAVDWSRVKQDIVISSGRADFDLSGRGPEFVKQAVRDACVGLEKRKLGHAEVQTLSPGRYYIANVRCSFFNPLTPRPVYSLDGAVH